MLVLDDGGWWPTCPQEFVPWYFKAWNTATFDLDGGFTWFCSFARVTSFCNLCSFVGQLAIVGGMWPKQLRSARCFVYYRLRSLRCIHQGADLPESGLESNEFKIDGVPRSCSAILDVM